MKWKHCIALNAQLEKHWAKGSTQLIYWSSCWMFPPIEDEIWGGVDGHKILRQKSYHFARFLHLPVKYVTFHITWVATFLHRKIRYIKLFITLFRCQIFFLSSAKTFLVQEIYLFWTGSSGWCNFCAKLYEKDIFSICSLKEMDEVRLMKAF